MKNNVLSKSIFALVLLWMVNLTMSAVTPKNYRYDTKMEGDRIVEKVVFAENNGILKRVMKYEFSYNDNGFVTEKKTFRWDGSKKEWEPYYLMSYEYETGNENINTRYVMWDKQSRKYCINEQMMAIPIDNYETIFS